MRFNFKHKKRITETSVGGSSAHGSLAGVKGNMGTRSRELDTKERKRVRLVIDNEDKKSRETSDN